MRFYFLLALAWNTHFALAFGASVNYEVSPLPSLGYVTVRATVSELNSNLAPVIEIKDSYASVDDFYAEVENLHIVSPAGKSFLHVQADGEVVRNMWYVNESLDASELVFEYNIKVRQEAPGAVARFKPAMTADYYYSSGFPLFLYPIHYHQSPEQLNSDQFSVQFNLPKLWNAITSFETGAGEFVTDSLEKLLLSSVALGDYRRTTRLLPSDATLVVAVRGSWQFSDEELADTVTSIISEQVNMMGTWHSPIYTVTLTQHDDAGSSSGSGLTDAFEMFTYKDVAIDGLYFLIGHENFHYWNGHRIIYEAARNRWFSEGFTNYYTGIFLARSGIIALDEAITLFSDLYQPYYQSPISDQIDFEDAGNYFWNWNEYSQHFYTKGMLIAMMVDVTLRSRSKNTKSLDEFMRILDQKLAFSGRQLENNFFLAELKAYSGQDWTSFMERNVSGKAMLQINSVIDAAGMTIVSEDCDRPDLGATILPYFCENKEPCNYIATNVAIDGPAYAAGLRDGDRIVEKNHARKTPHSPVSLKILKADGKVKEFTYTAGIRTVQCRNLRFVPNPSPMQKEIRESIWTKLPKSKE